MNTYALKRYINNCLPIYKDNLLQDIEILRKEFNLKSRPYYIEITTKPIYIGKILFGRYKIAIGIDQVGVFKRSLLAKNIDKKYLHPHISHVFYRSYNHIKLNFKYRSLCTNETAKLAIEQCNLLSAVDIIQSCLSNIDIYDNYTNLCTEKEIIDFCINYNKYIPCNYCGYIKKFIRNLPIRWICKSCRRYNKKNNLINAF